ncbi:tubulin polyglutamylase TTLL5 [Patella vulgata]|uniref:tubulin polyglutamylase TTLL5 n=1 Tax=Patella vulgata TaxID=6465 RepID=UPI00217FA9A9|nr:tubulin polyglutamylase TTLL5 [Patella vulgata]
MASRGSDSDGGSMTPSERSDEERSEHDSDYETDEEEEESSDNLNVVWTGYGKKNPVMLFKVEAIMNKKSDFKTVGERYHMAYKFANTECKIIRNILQTHGLHEIHPNSSDYNIVWSNGHLKPFTLRSMTEYQKINHFPRSYELTRKDRLFKNIQRMQQVKGLRHFDFIPSSFVLPGEYQDFCSAFLKDKGPWIVKPVASSRGRGVFLINHPEQAPLDENVIVCKYVANPLLIDGFKFDVRLYIAVTSYDPLVIYLFEEGLTRFATVKYEKTNRSIRNQCMHLTNYSVNKKSQDYVRNDDPEIEDYGNKWSLGALLRYLRSEGKDTAALMMRIEDVIMKTIISVELPVATACKMFMPHRGNCFELYGFDILIDDTLKPWIIEVNLSPSLACDSPLDLKIKGNMLCDLFSLTGIVCHDPMVKTLQQSKRNLEIASKLASRAKWKNLPRYSARARPSSACSQKRPLSAGSTTQKKEVRNPALAGLSGEEIKILRRVKEEESRRKGWVRIFPSADSWDTHSQYLQFNTTHNLMLHQRLYAERHKTGSKTGASLTSTGQRSRNTYLQITGSGSHTKLDPERSVEAYAQALLRTRQYERRLGPRKKRKKGKKGKAGKVSSRRMKLAQGVAEDLQDEGEGQSDTEVPQISDDEPVIEPEPEPVPVPTKKMEKIAPTNKNPPIPTNQIKIKEKESEVVNKPVTPVVVEKPEEKEETEKTVKKVTYTEVPAPTGAVARFEEKPPPVEEPPQTPTPPPSPPPTPPEPRYNVVGLLNKGRTLSKVQARSAFAMYLVRVEDRLLTDSNVLSTEAIDALNEQMDLVLRFLKRAAVNLQQSFKVVVPSRKLPLSDRKRILAKQLGDFVHIYNKETEQLKSRQQIDKTHLRRGESTEGLNENKFDHFVKTVSEAELEDVLTTYTRINKSASIFLGSNSKSTTSTSDTTTQPPISTSNTTSTTTTETLVKRKDSDNGLVTWEDVPRTFLRLAVRSASNTDLRAVNNHGAFVGNNRPISAKHTYTDAVSIYSQRLLRPRSASTGNMAKGKSPTNRPVSAVVQRPVNPSFAPSEPTVDTYNEQAIQDALQRLAVRQQARQYSAFNGSCVLSQENIATRPPSGYHGNRPGTASSIRSTPDNNYSNNTGANFNHQNIVSYNNDNQQNYVAPKIAKVRYTSEENITRPTTSYKSTTSYMSSKPQSTSHGRQNVHHRNANTTFNTFIEDAGQVRDIANAYGQITGNTHYSTGGYHNSRQLQFAQQQMFKQQRLMEQSKALLEQSRAKHQAMVAQAHAAQRTLNGSNNTDGKNDHSNSQTRVTSAERSKQRFRNDMEYSKPKVNSAQQSEHTRPRVISAQQSEHSKSRVSSAQQSEHSKPRVNNVQQHEHSKPRLNSAQQPEHSKPGVNSAQQSEHSNPRANFAQLDRPTPRPNVDVNEHALPKKTASEGYESSQTRPVSSKQKNTKTQQNEKTHRPTTSESQHKQNDGFNSDGQIIETRQERIHKKTLEAQQKLAQQKTLEAPSGENLSENENNSQSFAPKPPDQPSSYKKLPNSYRIARTNATNSNDEKALNFDFYNSLKYDVHTGQTRSRGGDNW